MNDYQLREDETEKDCFDVHLTELVEAFLDRLPQEEMIESLERMKVIFKDS